MALTARVEALTSRLVGSGYHLDGHAAVLSLLVGFAVVGKLAETDRPNPRWVYSPLHQEAAHRLYPPLAEFEVVLLGPDGVRVPRQLHAELGVVPELLDQEQKEGLGGLVKVRLVEAELDAGGLPLGARIRSSESGSRSGRGGTDCRSGSDTVAGASLPGPGAVGFVRLRRDLDRLVVGPINRGAARRHQGQEGREHQPDLESLSHGIHLHPRQGCNRLARRGRGKNPAETSGCGGSGSRPGSRRRYAVNRGSRPSDAPLDRLFIQALASARRPAQGGPGGQMKTGFVGLGSMGSPMAVNLLRAGHELTVFNRTRSRAEELAGEGARVADSPADAARNAEALITMLADDHAVEEVLFNGVIGGLRRGAIHISMS